MSYDRTARIDWEKMNVKFVDVLFVVKNQLHLEAHVDDPETLETVIGNRMETLRAQYAVYPTTHGWTVKSYGKDLAFRWRDYPTRDAAEMVAIHGA